MRVRLDFILIVFFAFCCAAFATDPPPRDTQLASELHTRGWRVRWVNRAGVWAENPWQVPATAVPRLLRWEPGPGGQHIELGISEMNLFMLLGQLGMSHELNGELLLPVRVPRADGRPGPPPHQPGRPEPQPDRLPPDLHPVVVPEHDSRRLARPPAAGEPEIGRREGQHPPDHQGRPDVDS